MTLFRVNVQSNFYFFVPRNRLISFRARDNGRFAAAGFAKTLAQVHRNGQDIFFDRHLNVFHASVPHFYSILGWLFISH